MLTKETLEQLSEEELEKIYQEKKSEYDQRVRKHKRIQDLLTKKGDKLKKFIKDLQNEIDFLHVKHPGITVDLGGENEDPEQLKATIQKHHTLILNLQSKQIQQKKQLKEIKLEIMRKQTEEKFLQTEIDQLIAENDDLTNKTEDSAEKMELAVITSEYQSTQDSLDTLTVEIEHLHRKLHQRG